MKPSQLLIYTRPWEVELHLQLARQLTAELGSVPVRFATFFSAAARAVRAAGGEAIELLPRLRAVNPAAVTDAELSQLDLRLQEQFGTGLNLLIHSERFLPERGAEVADFVRRHYAVLDELVLPGTLSLGSMYDHFVYWLAGSLAALRGGHHFAFVACGLPPGRVLALRTPWEAWEGVPESQTDALLAEVRAALVRPPEERIEYMRPRPIPRAWTRLQQRWEEISALRTDYRNGTYFRCEDDVYSVGSWWRNRWRLWTRRVHDADFDVQTAADLELIRGPLVYVPLHLEPEATILMYSPWARDQFEVCRQISQALPAGWTAVIKENPKMGGARPREFYRGLRQFPNLRLVHPRVPSYGLIQRSELTLALAGNAALEAKVAGRRGAVLARAPFRFLFSETEQLELPLKPQALRRCLEAPATQVDPATWSRWVRGTFPGRGAQSWHAGRFQIDPSAENAGQYARFVLGCLGQVAGKTSNATRSPK